jgi:hypothetical protein
VLIQHLKEEDKERGTEEKEGAAVEAALPQLYLSYLTST